MRIALAVILFVHGFAHLAGFLIPWRIATLKDMPYKTTILAKSVNVGDLGIRVIGILWLVAALAFAVSAIGVLARASWWLPITVLVTGFSFLLCIVEWPEARIGPLVNIGISMCLLIARYME